VNIPFFTVTVIPAKVGEKIPFHVLRTCPVAAVNSHELSFENYFFSITVTTLYR